MTQIDAGKWAACPFCGGTSIDIETITSTKGDSHSYMVSCDNCEAIGPGMNLSLERAHTAWNTRTPPTGNAMREALALAVSHIEHMATWITKNNKSPGYAGYSFESLGEDMPGIKAALAQPQQQREDVQPVAFDRDVARAAAETANKLYKQWMPQQWLLLFMDAYEDIAACRAAPPPLPDSAGAGGEREAIKRAEVRDRVAHFHRNACYPDAMRHEIDECVDGIMTALSPHSGKSDG